MKTNVLVVVDMQPKFKSCTKVTVRKVLERIKQAQKKNFDIIVLRYRNHGSIAKPLLKQLRKTKYSSRLKYRNDGSYQVVQTLQLKQHEPRKFYLCGVNTGACVYDTTLGLRRCYPRAALTVLLDACNDNYREFTKLTRIRKLYPKYVNLTKEDL